MPKCFFKGTSLEVWENGMQQVPGFLPRRSGVIRGRTEKKRQASYGELMLLLLWEIPPSEFSVRMINMKNRGELGRFLFQDNGHKKRFREKRQGRICLLLESDYGFAAAVFLLSADPFLWDRAGKHITENGIQYRKIFIHGVEPDGYALFCAARKMSGHGPGLALAELGDPELINDRLLQIILGGILISRHGLWVLKEGGRRLDVQC